MEEKSTKKSSPGASESAKPMDRKEKIAGIIGVVLCVLLIPILVINCILIVKGLTSDDVPSIGGKIPLIVLTESMEPEINAGDIIICQELSKEDIKSLKKGDVISFYDPAGNGTSIVTHEIYEDPYIENGKIYFVTKGINNLTKDKKPVSQDKIVGIYKGTRIPIIGHIAMFMQSTAGLIICIFVPLGALVAYELLRRKKQDKVKDNDIEALMAELKALKEQTSSDNRDIKNEAQSADTVSEGITSSGEDSEDTVKEAATSDEENKN
ncbi:MAG: signal peptidase I [Clostridia bacterium]|nr:signal peptidase I [Clostridia bacterium]